MQRILRAIGYAALALLLACVCAVAIARAWPKAPLRTLAPGSTAISTERGELLRLTLAADGQYRLWVDLERMPQRLPAAVVLYEDRWFYQHPGVNPMALARAVCRNSLGGRRFGASTITMQLARRLYRLDSRSAPGKLRQITLALWLEMRYSKHDILEAYLNLAPYGRNVEGVGAASLIYFGSPVARLSVPQLMTLAVIPQNPRERRPTPTAQAGSALDEARSRLWVRWLAREPLDVRFSNGMAAVVPSRSPEQLPFLAPHFTDALLRETSGDVRTTLDLQQQRTVERVLRAYIGGQSALGIRNAGALLLELNGSRAPVRAYVGSADYRDVAIDGQVNAVTAKRSPGSTLKPFVYGLALDQGLLHPRTILKDVPTAFGPFSPENFDGRFVGPIAAEDALIRSRNVPAVAVASQLSRPNLYDFLQQAGVSRLQSERHYGLALALGGGEVSMEELGRMYALLLNGGRLPALQTIADAPPDATPSAGARLLSEEASFIVLDMLKKNPRPDTGLPAMPSVAWKTGTSWGFHDAWSVAVFGRYVLVVWIGNFDNSGNPAFVGIQAAAPLLFRIVDALRSQGQDAGEFVRRAPANVAHVEVCAASGDLPNAACPQTLTTWYIPGKSPIRISNLHRIVYFDADGRRACGPGAGVHQEVYEFWTSDMLRLFREAGMPRRVAPPAPDCHGVSTDGAAIVEASAGGDDSQGPRIVSPVRGLVYTVRINQSAPLSLRADAAAGTQALYWFAGNAYLGRAPFGESLAWLPPQAGRYSLRAVDDRGFADTRELVVDFLP
ncbi:MAG: penicillin-binding protein 1C [Gammaproteobacteria bacterium]